MQISILVVLQRLWCIPKHRYANINELLNLQGFSDNFVQVVCSTRLKKQIGNSMSVNVIRDIIIKLL
jgi:site-specific DNA-cytosine methylase